MGVLWLYEKIKIDDKSPLTPTPTVITSSPVLEAIKQVNKQIFVEHYNAVDVTYTEAPEGWISILGIRQEFIVLIRGRVPAGFDLQQLSEEDIWISSDGKRIQLTLPPPVIFADNVAIDFENSRAISQSDKCPGFICQGTLTAYQNQILPAGEQLLMEFSYENGIIEQTARDGKRYYEQFLKSLGFEDVRVIVKGYEL